MSVIDEVVNDLCSKLAQRSIQEVKKAREKQIQEAEVIHNLIYHTHHQIISF